MKIPTLEEYFKLIEKDMLEGIDAHNAALYQLMRKFEEGNKIKAIVPMRCKGRSMIVWQKPEQLETDYPLTPEECDNGE